MYPGRVDPERRRGVALGSRSMTRTESPPRARAAARFTVARGLADATLLVGHDEDRAVRRVGEGRGSAVSRETDRGSGWLDLARVISSSSNVPGGDRRGETSSARLAPRPSAVSRPRLRSAGVGIELGARASPRSAGRRGSRRSLRGRGPPASDSGASSGIGLPLGASASPAFHVEHRASRRRVRFNLSRPPQSWCDLGHDLSLSRCSCDSLGDDSRQACDTLRRTHAGRFTAEARSALGRGQRRRAHVKHRPARCERDGPTALHRPGHRRRHPTAWSHPSPDRTSSSAGHVACLAISSPRQATERVDSLDGGMHCTTESAPRPRAARTVSQLGRAARCSAGRRRSATPAAVCPLMASIRTLPGSERMHQVEQPGERSHGSRRHDVVRLAVVLGPVSDDPTRSLEPEAPPPSGEGRSTRRSSGSSSVTSRSGRRIANGIPGDRRRYRRRPRSTRGDQLGRAPPSSACAGPRSGPPRAARSGPIRPRSRQYIDICASARPAAPGRPPPRRQDAGGPPGWLTAAVRTAGSTTT